MIPAQATISTPAAARAVSARCRDRATLHAQWSLVFDSTSNDRAQAFRAGSLAPGLFLVCRACFDSSRVRLPLTTRWRGSHSEAKGGNNTRREAGPEEARSKDASRGTRTGYEAYGGGR